MASVTYPRHLKVDFTKLPPNTLKRYAWYFNLDHRSSPTQELAAACARHFSVQLDSDEDTIITSFTYFTNGTLDENLLKETNYSLETTTGTTKKRKRMNNNSNNNINILDIGRTVAAKINGEWLLTNILKYNKRQKTYKVEDADEMTENPASYDVTSTNILPLPSTEESFKKIYHKNNRVLALYPGTSTFYAATIVKRIEPTGKGRGTSNKVIEYALKFDDDEREAGGEVKTKKISSLEVVDNIDE